MNTQCIRHGRLFQFAVCIFVSSLFMSPPAFGVTLEELAARMEALEAENRVLREKVAELETAGRAETEVADQSSRRVPDINEDEIEAVPHSGPTVETIQWEDHQEEASGGASFASARDSVAENAREMAGDALTEAAMDLISHAPCCQARQFIKSSLRRLTLLTPISFSSPHGSIQSRLGWSGAFGPAK